MMRLDKVQENRLRRVAARQGYTLVKSRARDRRRPDYGRFRLIGHWRYDNNPDYWAKPESIARLLKEPL
jgi:hypothetical protein